MAYAATLLSLDELALGTADLGRSFAAKRRTGSSSTHLCVLFAMPDGSLVEYRGTSSSLERQPARPERMVERVEELVREGYVDAGSVQLPFRPLLGAATSHWLEGKTEVGAGGDNLKKKKKKTRSRARSASSRRKRSSSSERRTTKRKKKTTSSRSSGRR